MKNLFLATAALSLLMFGACKKNEMPRVEKTVKAGVLPNGSTLPGIINTNTELVAGGTYYIDGKSYVVPGGDLVINAGVTLKGIKKALPADASALIVTRGGQIHADGTSGTIIFTSNEATPAVGDWGGVVILGRATTNQPTTTSIEGINLPSLPPGVDVGYGGSSPTDNSGVFKYVQILYAGANVSTNNELNALTLGGVGSGTEINHVEASYGRDDAFEFFGGTVDASYLVSVNTNDDILDFDHGYTGNIQYVLALRNSSAPGFSFNDANGIESDNAADGATNTSLSPKTNANISYATFIAGPTSAFSGTRSAARLRRGSGFTISNSIFSGYSTGIEVEDIASGSFSGNVVHAFTNLGTIPGGNTTYLNSSNSNAAAEINFALPFTLGGSFDPASLNHSSVGAIISGNYWFAGWSTL